MPKIIKKKFFEIEIPLLGEKYECFGNSISEFEGRSIKMDITRKLKGKSVDIIFVIITKDGKTEAHPKKLTLMPFFIRHMLHTGIDYVEDSFNSKTKDSLVVIKPFFITRKKVSRAVRKTLRNSAKNWLIDYLKEKSDSEVFDEILSGTLQKHLAARLKKVYPLAVSEIRIFEILEPFKDKQKEKSKIEIKIKEKESEEKSL